MGRINVKSRNAYGDRRRVETKDPRRLSAAEVEAMKDPVVLHRFSKLMEAIEAQGGPNESDQ